MVHAQRLVQGRTGTPGQPPRTADGRASHQHRHLPGTPVAGRRAAPRAHPAHPLRAVLRAVRLRRRGGRGPRAAPRPAVPRGLRRGPALGRTADRGADQRLHPQRSDAGAPRLPGCLTLRVRGPRADRAHAALAGAGHRRRGRTPGGAAGGPRTHRPRPPRRAAPRGGPRRGRRAAARAAAVRTRTGAAGADHRDVPRLGRPVRGRAAPQGRRRPAPRGHRSAPGTALRGCPPPALPRHRRTVRARRLDELRRRAPAHRAEVLRAGPARRQGGRRPASGVVHPEQDEPADDPSGPSGGRAGAGAPGAVRQPGGRHRPHPGHAARHGGPRLREHGAAGQVQACGTDGGRNVHRHRPLGPGPRLDPVLLRGRAVRGDRALLPGPGLLLRPQPHLRLTRTPRDGAGRRTVRQGGPGDAGRRPPALLRAQPDRHGQCAPAPAGARRLCGPGQRGPRRRQATALGAGQQPAAPHHGRRRPRVRGIRGRGAAQRAAPGGAGRERGRRGG